MKEIITFLLAQNINTFSLRLIKSDTCTNLQLHCTQENSYCSHFFIDLIWTVVCWRTKSGLITIKEDTVSLW